MLAAAATNLTSLLRWHPFKVSLPNCKMKTMVLLLPPPLSRHVLVRFLDYWYHNLFLLPISSPHAPPDLKDPFTHFTLCQNLPSNQVDASHAMISVRRKTYSLPFLHLHFTAKWQFCEHPRCDAAFIHRNCVGFFLINSCHCCSVLLRCATYLQGLDPDFISHLHEYKPSLFHRAFWWFTRMQLFIFEYKSVWHGLISLSTLGQYIVPECCYQQEDMPLSAMALIVQWCLFTIPFPLGPVC